MVANLALLVPKNANLAFFETSWHFLEEGKVPSSFWHFLAFFDVPSKFIQINAIIMKKPSFFLFSSSHVVTKNNVWVKNVALNLVLVQENQI